jgi:PilZ domain
LLKEKEKRRAPRMPADWNVQARLLGNDEPLGPVQMADVSKYGVSVRLAHSVEKESILKLSFEPSDGGGEVHAYATVAWSVEADHPQAGLRFMGIGEADEERIASLVERWMHTARSKQ